MEYSEMEKLLEENGIPKYNHVPDSEEELSIPEDQLEMQVLAELTLRHPLQEGHMICPRYLLGQDQDCSEIYVCDFLVKGDKDDFYLPFIHTGSESVPGVEKIEVDHIESLVIK